MWTLLGMYFACFTWVVFLTPFCVSNQSPADNHNTLQSIAVPILRLAAGTKAAFDALFPKNGSDGPLPLAVPMSDSLAGSFKYMYEYVCESFRITPDRCRP